MDPMLMPTFSVTAIGLLVGLTAILIMRRQPGRIIVLGVVGSWAGFVLGAVIGVTVDVIIGTGVYVAIAGHLAAALGAGGAVTRWCHIRYRPVRERPPIRSTDRHRPERN